MDDPCEVDIYVVNEKKNDDKQNDTDHDQTWKSQKKSYKQNIKKPEFYLLIFVSLFTSFFALPFLFVLSQNAEQLSRFFCLEVRCPECGVGLRKRGNVGHTPTYYCAKLCVFLCVMMCYII